MTVQKELCQVEVLTFGREATDDFFNKGMIQCNEYPFLIFTVNNLKVEVVRSSSINELLRYPDETRVMKQWPGQWRSDFFHFSVGELRKFRNRKGSKILNLVPEMEVIDVRVNVQGRVEEARITFLDHEYLYGRVNSYFDDEAMELMIIILEVNPALIKVTKNSRNSQKLPDEKYSGEEWLRRHEMKEYNNRRWWSRILSDKEKRALGLAPLISDTNHRIKLKGKDVYYAGFDKNKLRPLSDEFWRCTRRDTAERHLQKIKDSGDARVWEIEAFPSE
jgi:hypothetical protein